MVGVFVISSLPAVRIGLRTLIEADPRCRVTGDAGSLSATPRGMGNGPDVIVLDADPATMATEIAAALEEVPSGIVLLGPVVAGETLPSLLAGHSFAYLPRDAGSAELLAAIHAVAAGLVVIDPSAGSRLLHQGPSARDLPSLESAETLTARERQVLQLVAQGLPNKIIARRLDISEHTVKFHVAAVLAKLGAASRTEAVHLGARRGLISL
jgi:DNA-binding NarL/FixJ family response regulator